MKGVLDFYQLLSVLFFICSFGFNKLHDIVWTIHKLNTWRFNIAFLINSYSNIHVLYLTNNHIIWAYIYKTVYPYSRFSNKTCNLLQISSKFFSLTYIYIILYINFFLLGIFIKIIKFKVHSKNVQESDIVIVLYCFLLHSPTICYCPRRRIARKSCSSRRPASLTSPTEITNTYCQKKQKTPIL